jgi:hypothetical protein
VRSQKVERKMEREKFHETNIRKILRPKLCENFKCSSSKLQIPKGSRWKKSQIKNFNHVPFDSRCGGAHSI